MLEICIKFREENIPDLFVAIFHNSTAGKGFFLHNPGAGQRHYLHRSICFFERQPYLRALRTAYQLYGIFNNIPGKIDRLAVALAYFHDHIPNLDLSGFPRRSTGNQACDLYVAIIILKLRSDAKKRSAHLLIKISLLNWWEEF